MPATATLATVRSFANHGYLSAPRPPSSGRQHHTALKAALHAETLVQHRGNELGFLEAFSTRRSPWHRRGTMRMFRPIAPRRRSPEGLCLRAYEDGKRDGIRYNPAFVHHLLDVERLHPGAAPRANSDGAVENHVVRRNPIPHGAPQR